MRIITKLFICAVAMFTAFACSPNSSPSGVVTAVNKALQSGDYETVANYIYTDDLGESALKGNNVSFDVDEFRSGLADTIGEKAGKAIEKKGGIESFEILNETIKESGDEAVVTVKTTYGDGSTDESDTEVVKHDGKWYLTLAK